MHSLNGDSEINISPNQGLTRSKMERNKISQAEQGEKITKVSRGGSVAFCARMVQRWILASPQIQPQHQT
jgi:hypothetical protein